MNVINDKHIYFITYEYTYDMNIIFVHMLIHICKAFMKYTYDK